eukprot:1178744-Prorocentrum_minimum.AAC.3
MERLQHCRDARDARLRGSFRRPHQQTGRQVQACVQRCGMGQRSGVRTAQRCRHASAAAGRPAHIAASGTCSRRAARMPTAMPCADFVESLSETALATGRLRSPCTCCTSVLGAREPFASALAVDETLVCPLRMHTRTVTVTPLRAPAAFSCPRLSRSGSANGRANATAVTAAPPPERPPSACAVSVPAPASINSRKPAAGKSARACTR